MRGIDASIPQSNAPSSMLSCRRCRLGAVRFGSAVRQNQSHPLLSYSRYVSHECIRAYVLILLAEGSRRYLIDSRNTPFSHCPLQSVINNTFLLLPVTRSEIALGHEIAVTVSYSDTVAICST